MICTQPGLHTIEISITNDKNDVFSPIRVICSQKGIENGTSFIEHINSRFKKAARASTVDTPRKLKVPSPSLVLLSHDALITIASVPGLRGDLRIAYAFVPLIF